MALGRGQSRKDSGRSGIWLIWTDTLMLRRNFASVRFHKIMRDRAWLWPTLAFARDLFVGIYSYIVKTCRRSIDAESTVGRVFWR